MINGGMYVLIENVLGGEDLSGRESLSYINSAESKERC